MAKNNQMTFYNYMNLTDYVDKIGIIQSDDFLRWFKDICNTKITMFEYENLPKGLTTQILEQALMFNNFLCFYNSTEYGLVLCRYFYGGDYDLYWKPIKVNLLTLSGKPLKNNVPYEDIILVRDNPSDIIPFLTLNGYINKIIELEKTLDILVRLVRFPTILTGDKEQTTMLKQLLKQNIKCEGFVIGAKGFKDHLEQFNINMPCKLIEVYELMEKYRDKAINSIGIYSVDEKRERIVSSEIEANNDYVDIVYNGMLNQRKLFVKLCNEKFGTNIKLIESYRQIKQEDIDYKKKETKAIEDTKANAQNLIEKEVKTDEQ